MFRKADNKTFYFSILKLYNDSFVVGFPLIIIVSIAAILFDKSYENFSLLMVVFSALLFFKVFKNNKVVKTHQIYFHQGFVLIAVIISILWYFQIEGFKQLLYLMMVGSIASYLFIQQTTTVIYIVLYHTFLLLLSFKTDAVIINYVVYSFVFCIAAIFTSRWLNQLLTDSQYLQMSQQKFKSLFEQGSSAIFLIKQQGEKFIIIDLNKSCTSIFGFNSDELINYGFEKLCVDDSLDKSEIRKKLQNLKNNESLVFTGLFTKKNGDRITVEASFLKIELQGEQIIQVLINDITERQLSEKTIAESVNNFKNIVDNSPISIFIFTENELVYKNSHADFVFNEYLDHTQNNLYEIFPENQKHVLDKLLTDSHKTASDYAEIILGQGSNEKKYSISKVHIIYNGINSTLLMLMDISIQHEHNLQKIRAEIAEESNKNLSEEIRKHKATQLDLIANTSKLNALFESSNNLFILTIDRDLNISSFNSSFKKMMKYHLDVDVEIGNDFLNIFPIAERAYGKLIKHFKKALRGESVEIISHFRTKQGEIWIESFISPIKVEGEDIKEIAFIAHNITEKVENERKVLDSEANNRATVSAIPDMLFKVNKDGYFTYYRLNEEGGAVLREFSNESDLVGCHILEVFKNKKQGGIFLKNIQKALRTGKVHKQNFIVPFIIGRTKKRMVFENRYSRVNANEVIVITRDITDKIEFETQLIESVKEKEILLKEVHHRVKNNLQVISSILNLQSSYVEDQKTLEIINESQNRIRSMSYIHESLYQTKDFSSIDFHDYITNLVQNLIHSYQLYTGRTKLNLNIERVHLLLDQAIPCGLILNELVSNSLKYAYPEGTEGEIQIEIKQENGKVIMRVEDFGQGLPKGFKIEESESLGLGLVDTLVDQIDGELILITENGTKYLIIFEKQDL